MNTELLKKTLPHGAFIGLAISSRFLLNFQEGAWTEILSFVLLFGMYSGLIMWVKEYQKTLPEEKITFKQVVNYSFQVFLVGAVISSAFKFIFFQYIKPTMFTIVVEQYEQIYNGFINESKTLLLQAQKEKNASEIEMIKEFIQKLIWWKSTVATAYFEPIRSLIGNIIGGLFLGLFISPLFRSRQQKSTPIK